MKTIIAIGVLMTATGCATMSSQVEQQEIARLQAENNSLQTEIARQQAEKSNRDLTDAKREVMGMLEADVKDAAQQAWQSVHAQFRGTYIETSAYAHACYAKYSQAHLNTLEEYKALAVKCWEGR